METVEICMFVKTQLDTGKRVLKELFRVLIVNILLKISMKLATILPRTMLHQVSSNRRFVLPVNKSSQATTLSDNIGERIMELSNGNLVIL